MTNNTLSKISKFFQAIPSVRGKIRIAKTFLGSSSMKQDILINTQSGTFFVPSLSEPMALHLLINGMHEPDTAKFVSNNLLEGGVFVDVGANIGIFSVLAAKKVGPSGKVMAVEPSSRILSYLKENIRINKLSNIIIKNCAAHSSNLSHSFYEAPIDHFGMGSLAPQFNSAPILVTTQTLDHMLAEEQIEHVDVLKIDVEGFESRVFQGAERLLTNERPPIIIFEFCDWAEARMPQGEVGDAQRILKEWNYNLWRLSDYVKNKKPLKNILVDGFEMLVGIRQI